MADIGTLPPEVALEQQRLTRQQQMAQALMQNNQQPQGQMIGNRFVAPSFFQNLQPVANMLAGAYITNQAEEKQLALANKLREKENIAIADYMGQLQGRAGTPDRVTELAGPYTGNIPAPTATVAGRPAVEANPTLANMNVMQDPYAPSWLRQHAITKITQGPKWEKAEYTDEKTGKTRQGVIDVNSANPISTFQVGGVKPEMSAYERASLNMRGAELADQGIAGYGAGGGGPRAGTMPSTQVGTTVAGQPQVQPAFTPSTLPTYQNDPSLTPRQNREQALKFSEKQQSNVANAKDSFDLMKEAGKILSSNAPSSGALSNLVTYAGEVVNLPFGARKQESEADAALKMLSGALTMKQPRFEGPQGVLDVTLYQKLAGDLGNANIPVESRLATMKQMVNLQKKYYPSGDWDSIDTALKGSEKVSLQAPQYATNPQTGERRMSTDGGKTWKPAR